MSEMKVRVVKPLGPLALKPKGFVMTPTTAVARMWIQRGWVEPVEDEAQVQTAMIEPERNAAIRTEPPKKRKRGRPRKYPLPT